MVLFISCYTDVYEEEAMGLIESLKEWNLPHKVEFLESMGSWNLNTKLKTTFIKKMLHEQEEPVVWLDADARVRKDPDLFKTLQDNTDFACHLRMKKELLSGTMYFNNNDKCKKILDEWIKVNEKKPNVFDQKNLHEVVRRHKDLRWTKLPHEYCLFDIICRQENKKEKDAVIWHRQASRRLKMLANGKRKKRKP